MANDALTIAEAIDPTRKEWCWTLCKNERHRKPDNLLTHYGDPECAECGGTSQGPHIGPHNILRVIEWAIKRYRESDRQIHRIMPDCLDTCMRGMTRAQCSSQEFAEKCQMYIAAAIRAEQGEY